MYVNEEIKLAVKSNRDRELGHTENDQVERAGDMMLESKDTKTGRLGGRWSGLHRA